MFPKYARNVFEDTYNQRLVIYVWYVALRTTFYCYCKINQRELMLGIPTPLVGRQICLLYQVWCKLAKARRAFWIHAGIRNKWSVIEKMYTLFYRRHIWFLIVKKHGNCYLGCRVLIIICSSRVNCLKPIFFQNLNNYRKI